MSTEPAYRWPLVLRLIWAPVTKLNTVGDRMGAEDRRFLGVAVLLGVYVSALIVADTFGWVYLFIWRLDAWAVFALCHVWALAHVLRWMFDPAAPGRTA